MTREEFNEKFQDYTEDYDVLLADGFDDALIGMCSVSYRAIYDYNKMIDILVQGDDMDEVDALEYLHYNVVGAYVGEMTPIYMM
jgi:hypothetical protein